jgi:stress response protein YsnF
VESKVDVDLTREQIKNSPEYDPTVPVDREYETHLVEFYGLSKYWEYLRTDPQKEKFGSQIPEDES